MAGKQHEFKGMPGRSALGKKAIAYLNLKEDRKTLDDDIEKAKEELVEHFLALGKKSIQIDGYTIMYSHVEKDKITVKGGKDE